MAVAGADLPRDLIAEFREWRESTRHRVFVHNEFYEFTGGDVIGEGPFAKRANLVLQHLAAHGRTSVVKGVRGNGNQGWRRTPFGGNKGSHFYCWWAPADAGPVRGLGLPEGSIAVRMIRHHDDHMPLTADKREDYTELTPERIITSEDMELPWTETQLQFANSEDPVRVLIGYPGTGKTTTLWDAVVRRSGESVLYITWSPRLAEMADEFFQSFSAKDMTVTTRSFTEVLNGILGSAPVAFDRSVSGERNNFQKFLAKIPPAELGEWKGRLDPLLTEMRAHLVGGALPHEPSLLEEPTRCRLSDAQYIKLRSGVIGREAAENVVRVAGLIERQNQPVEKLFPELERAFLAGKRVMTNKNVFRGERTKWLMADRIVVDEVQDLTPVEMAVPVLLARRIADERNGRPPFLLCAGDEGQTVRPTDFEWPAFKSLVQNVIAAPEQTQLEHSLRYPRGIATLVNNTRELYTELEKFDRPRYQAKVATHDTIKDEIIHCTAEPDDPELVRLIAEVAAMPGTALVGFSPDLMAGVPDDVRPQVLYPSEAKGCEYQAVCLLNPAAYLNRMLSDSEQSASTLDRFWLRTAIDNFRVALSRATETLILIDWHRDGRGKTSRLERLFLGVRPMVMTPAEVHVHLKAISDLSTDEYLQRSVADARAMVSVNPTIAVNRARNAVLFLGKRDVPGGVTDPALRREASECLVQVVWEVTASPEGLPAGETEASLLKLATASAAELDRMALDEAGEEHEEAAEDSETTELDPEESDTASGKTAKPLRRWEAARRLFEGATELAEADEIERGEKLLGMLRRIDRLPGQEAWIRAGLMPRAERLITMLRETARNVQLARVTGTKVHQYIKALVSQAGLEGMDPVAVADEIACIAAEKLVGANQPKDALVVMQQCREAPPMLMAKANEGMRNWAQASQYFEKAGEVEEALRCARSGVQIQRAIELAGKCGNERILPMLKWLSQVERLAREKPGGMRNLMGDEERQWLLDRLKEAQNQ